MQPIGSIKSYYFICTEVERLGQRHNGNEFCFVFVFEVCLRVFDQFCCCLLQNNPSPIFLDNDSVLIKINFCTLTHGGLRVDR